MKKISIFLVSVLFSFFIGWNLKGVNMEHQQRFDSDYALSIAEIWKSASDLYGGFGRLEEGFDWDAVCKESFYRAGNAQNDYQYYLELCRLMAFLEDGHTFVRPKENGLLGVLPLKMRYLDGNYYVTAIVGSHSLPLYSKLLEINGTDAHQYLKENIDQYIGIQTPLAREQRTIHFLTDYGERGTDIKLTFETPEGDQKEYLFRYERGRYNMNYSMIERLPAEGEILYESDTFLLREMEKGAPENNLHLVVKTMTAPVEETKAEYLEFILPHIIEAKGCILDYRYCNGGNSINGSTTLYPFVSNDTIQSTNLGYSLYSQKKSEYMYCALLAEQTAQYSKFGLEIEEIFYHKNVEIGKQMQQGRYYNETQEDLPIELLQLWEGIPKIDTPVVLLIDHNTGSAVDTTVLTANAWGLITIGTNTGGYTGNLAIIPLNNGYLTGFSVPRQFGPDGQDVQNNGAKAKIYVNYHVEDLQKNIDTLLEKAVEVLAEQQTK